MTTLWISGGIVTILLAILAFKFVRGAVQLAFFGLMAAIGVLVFQRKTTLGVIEWFMERDEERTMIGLGVVGWLIVLVICVGMIAAPSIIAYSAFR